MHAPDTEDQSYILAHMIPLITDKSHPARTRSGLIRMRRLVAPETTHALQLIVRHAAPKCRYCMRVQ
jgi:hypothetical protein